MNKLKKVYITSGDLNVVLTANGPFNACQKALKLYAEGKTLDPEYIYIDERGWRVEDAQWKIPVVLAVQMTNMLKSEGD